MGMWEQLWTGRNLGKVCDGRVCLAAVALHTTCEHAQQLAQPGHITDAVYMLFMAMLLPALYCAAVGAMFGATTASC